MAIDVPGSSLMDMLNDPEGFFGRKLWSGIWRGRVEDIGDPEQRGRMKVRVPAIHTTKANVVPVENLPWCEPCFSDAGQDYGEFYIPYRIGDWVWVMFEAGHPDYPVWLGSWFGQYVEDGQKVTEVPKECRNPRYPHRFIRKTRRGHKIEMSDEDEELEIKFTDAKGNFVWMDTQTNTMFVWWNGNKKEIVTGNSTLCVDGDYTVVVGRDRNTTIHGNEKRVLDGTHPDRLGDQDFTVSGSRRSTVGTDVAEHVTGNVNFVVDGDYIESADTHSSAVTGDETVEVGGTMYHVGSTIRHNSGGSAATPTTPIPPSPDPRLANPNDTIQERKVPFPTKVPDDYMEQSTFGWKHLDDNPEYISWHSRGNQGLNDGDEDAEEPFNVG